MLSRKCVSSLTVDDCRLCRGCCCSVCSVSHAYYMFQLRHAMQRQKNQFDNVNIDWNLSHDEGSTDFSDDETIIEDRVKYNPVKLQVMHLCSTNKEWTGNHQTQFYKTTHSYTCFDPMGVIIRLTYCIDETWNRTHNCKKWDLTSITWHVYFWNPAWW